MQVRATKCRLCEYSCTVRMNSTSTLFLCIVGRRNKMQDIYSIPAPWTECCPDKCTADVKHDLAWARLLYLAALLAAACVGSRLRARSTMCRAGTARSRWIFTARRFGLRTVKSPWGAGRRRGPYRVLRHCGSGPAYGIPSREDWTFPCIVDVCMCGVKPGQVIGHFNGSQYMPSRQRLDSG